MLNIQSHFIVFLQLHYYFFIFLWKIKQFHPMSENDPHINLRLLKSTEEPESTTCLSTRSTFMILSVFLCCVFQTKMSARQEPLRSVGSTPHVTTPMVATTAPAWLATALLTTWLSSSQMMEPTAKVSQIFLVGKISNNVCRDRDAFINQHLHVCETILTGSFWLSYSLNICLCLCRY